MFAPPSKYYTASTVLFHKYGGENVVVTNCMSQFFMFVRTKATVKLTNGNTVHAQVIDIILFSFTNFSIINPVGTVYYFPGHRSNTISSGDLKIYVGLQNVISETLEHNAFVVPKGRSWGSPYQTQNNLNHI